MLKVCFVRETELGLHTVSKWGLLLFLNFVFNGSIRRRGLSTKAQEYRHCRYFHSVLLIWQSTTMSGVEKQVLFLHP